MIPMPLLKKQIEQHPYPLIFATISGGHLYGFPSPDSDFDLRGVHVLPLKEVVGLQIGPETIEKSCVYDGLEIDLVTHDAKKVFLIKLDCGESAEGDEIQPTKKILKDCEASWNGSGAG